MEQIYSMQYVGSLQELLVMNEHCWRSTNCSSLQYYLNPSLMSVCIIQFWVTVHSLMFVLLNFIKIGLYFICSHIIIACNVQNPPAFNESYPIVLWYFQPRRFDPLYHEYTVAVCILCYAIRWQNNTFFRRLSIHNLGDYRCRLADFSLVCSQLQWIAARRSWFVQSHVEIILTTWNRLILVVVHVKITEIGSIKLECLNSI